MAEHAGRGPRILLIGHLDTVFEPDSPFQAVRWIDSVTARGPGIIDMKGGDVIIVQALKALAASGLLKDLRVTVIMTGDEEDPGEPVSLARTALIDLARRHDIAIGFEDGSGDPHRAVVARRGRRPPNPVAHPTRRHQTRDGDDRRGEAAEHPRDAPVRGRISAPAANRR